MPCGERPDASTTCAPASYARLTASYTAGSISSSVAPCPVIHFSRVPSMSRATTCGRHPVSCGDISAGHRLEHLAPQPLLQRLRDPDGAVGLLVGLEDRHDRARDGGQGAVERGERPGPVLEAAADVEPAGLELGGVRGRGELAVLALGRDPRLAVELPDRAVAEVAGGHVDHAVGQLELVEELLL